MNSAKISSSRRTLRPDFSVRWRGALIISIPVFCLFTSVFVIAELRFQTLLAVNRKDQSQKIIIETERLLLSLANAQTSVRGYALAQRKEFLKPYLQAKILLPVSLKFLDEQVSSKGIQRQQLQKIIAQSQQQITVLDQLKITSERQGKSALTQQLLNSELLMDELRQEINQFAEQEKLLQSNREAQVLQWRDLTNTVQSITLIVGLIGTFAALYLFNQLDEELIDRAIRLRESNLHLQAVFDNVVDGIIILNERGYIQAANTAVAEIFGYNLEEIPGKHLQRLIAESFSDDSGRVMDFLVGNNQDKLRLQQEIIGRRRDEKTFPMEFAFSKMELDNEHLFIAIVRDITERKQAEETLLKQAQLLDLANDTIMVRDLNDTILYWNQGAQRLYGYSSADAVGQSVHTLLKTEFLQPPEKVKEILFQDGYWNGELVHYRRDGTPVTVASGLTLQRNEFGPVAYLEINQDITQRKQSEAALRKSEELYRALVKNFPNGAVFLFDEQLRYNIAEGTGLAAVNVTSEELTGKTIWEILPPQTTQVIEPLYRAALRGEVIVTEIPYGDRLYIIHVLPVINAEGEILAGMAMTQDITQSKKAEEALRLRAEELAKMTTVLAQTTAVLEKNYSELDQFTYIVSHDLKAPLRAIANLSQWIEDDLEQHLTKDTRHQINLMRNRVHRMEALIDGLLQYSRSTRMQTNLEQVEVEALLKDVIDSLAPPSNFTVTIMPGMPKIITERLPLEQVFANLISNAIKHNKQPHQGQVVISGKEQQNCYEFAVADNGLGIAPEFQEKVFVIFQTLGSFENGENTGIGLAIVKKIIEDRGGTISIQSQLGKGAIFHFTWLKQIRKGEGQ